MSNGLHYSCWQYIVLAVHHRVWLSSHVWTYFCQCNWSQITNLVVAQRDETSLLAWKRMRHIESTPTHTCQWKLGDWSFVSNPYSIVELLLVLWLADRSANLIPLLSNWTRLLSSGSPSFLFWLILIFLNFVAVVHLWFDRFFLWLRFFHLWIFQEYHFVKLSSCSENFQTRSEPCCIHSSDWVHHALEVMRAVLVCRYWLSFFQLLLG